MIEKCYVIPVQSRCNCNCLHCISKIRNYNKPIEFLKPNKNYIENIALLKSRNIKRFEITGGGEPFLNNNLNEIVENIKQIIPDSFIKIYTNANILKPISNIDELNISVFHYDIDVNNKYMQATKKIELLEKIKYFRSINPECTIRLSIPLIKGGIDTPEKLDEFLEKTSKMVDSYVVRTLYPKTPNISQNYVDFEYSNPLVTFEKDNDVTEFDGIILWSDGELYNNWELNKKKHLYSYILLKPDSMTYINEIEKMIISHGFTIKKIYLLNDFKENAINLYAEKSLDYLKIIKSHLENTSYLFGNNGLIFILDKNLNMEDLVTDTYNLKNEIRNNYSFTQHKNGFLNINNQLSHLNLVHCPDPVIKMFERDLNTFDNDFETKKEISNYDFQKIKKYRSYSI